MEKCPVWFLRAEGQYRNIWEGKAADDHSGEAEHIFSVWQFLFDEYSIMTTSYCMLHQLSE